MRKPVEYKGVVYRSHKEIAETFGIVPDIFSKRLRKGHSVHTALTGEGLIDTRGGQSGTRVTYKDITYKSYAALCKAYGVSYFTFVRRKEKGYTLHQCVTGEGVIQGGKPGRKIPYEGKIYGSYAELCRDHNVDITLFRSRRKEGHGLHTCVTGVGLYGRGHHSKGNQCVYEGVPYESYKELCADFGISYNTFMKRKGKGNTITEALKN